jgi:AcrR family transcriptional regulator
MSPQRSNREALIEGALECIGERPTAAITARDICAASGANLASIAYHFDSKDALLARALEEGFRRWLAELAAAMGDLTGLSPAERLKSATQNLLSTMERHRGLVHAFLAAVARAPHDDELRDALARSYKESRRAVAALLDLGEDEEAIDAGALLLATFDGLLIQALVDRERQLDAAAVWGGIGRLSELADVHVRWS